MSKRPQEDYSESPDKSSTKPDPGAEEKPREKGALPFKNPSFQHSNVVGGRKKPWRTLKQILAAEALLDWPQVWLEREWWIKGGGGGSLQVKVKIT
jgi:hypothetical protein